MIISKQKMTLEANGHWQEVSVMPDQIIAIKK